MGIETRRDTQENSIGRGSAQMSNLLPFYISFLTKKDTPLINLLLTY